MDEFDFYVYTEIATVMETIFSLHNVKPRALPRPMNERHTPCAARFSTAVYNT